jgi:preprotein translocase subunit SecF
MKTHLHFIKYTKVWFTISIVLMLLGAGAMVNNKIQHGYFLKLGIDFTGGTLIELNFDKPKDNEVDLIKTTIDTALAEDIVKQITVTDKGTYIIHGKDLTSEQYDKAKVALKDKLGAFEEIRFNTIGPTIGASLEKKALLALVIASLAIVLYIAYAFRKVPKRVSPWRFGICAVVALAHDLFTTVGVFALMGYEVDALFITALLTVLGFSVHDTIVVFDRIRENLKNQGRDESFGDIADRSLNQTLARSINTSVSTLITLTALYIFGAESIKVFIFALLFGITVGTYSSIFVATPLLAMWQESKRVR